MGKESSIICSRLNKEYNYLMNFEMHDNIKNNILCKIQFLLKIILTNIIFIKYNQLIYFPKSQFCKF